jgi:hypothetical protein
LRVEFRSAVGVGASRSAVLDVGEDVGWDVAPLVGDVGEVALRLRESDTGN